MAFRDGSMQYPMYRDWKAFEKLAQEIMMSIEHDGDPQPLLHQFVCYLETVLATSGCALFLLMWLCRPADADEELQADGE